MKFLKTLEGTRELTVCIEKQIHKKSVYFDMKKLLHLSSTHFNTYSLCKHLLCYLADYFKYTKTVDE